MAPFFGIKEEQKAFTMGKHNLLKLNSNMQGV